MFPEKIRFTVITLSDRASRGEYEDLSGPAITGMLEVYFSEKSTPVEINNVIIPDDPGRLTRLLSECRENGTDVIITTGGTGLGPRDFTPDVVRPLLDKEIPGIMEMIRVKYGMEKPGALLSRSVAGVMGSSLVYCLPGSRKAVTEYCSEIMPTMVHALKMVIGIDDHSS